MAIKAIFGLGNEGREYRNTYHNVGSFSANYLEKNYGKEHPQIAFQDQIGGFMNVIGAPILKLVKKAGYKPVEILIIHDESDLPMGEYKLSFGGSSAGHKGVQSIIDNLQAANFWRLRIGVRDPNEKVRQKAEAFVLKPWSKADEEKFKKALESAWGEIQAKQLV